MLKQIDMQVYKVIAGEGKTFQASQNELAAMFSVSRRTMQRSLARLRAENLLQILEKKNKEGQFMVNIYLVNRAPKMTPLYSKYNMIIKTRQKTFISGFLVKNKSNNKQVVINIRAAYGQRTNEVSELFVGIEILSSVHGRIISFLPVDAVNFRFQGGLKMAYTTARPKGFISNWNPQQKTIDLLGQIEQVLATYHEHWPLTVRQIFYRLVGVYGYEKTDKAYFRLCNCMVLARRAKVIPFSAIRDDRFDRSEAACWSCPDHTWATFINVAEGYTKNKRVNQPCDIYLLAEARGMMPQLAKVAEPYSVPVLSSGGFDSLTAKYDMAEEVKRNNKQAIFLHIGDYDPSGVCIFDSLAADVIAFSDGMADFERIILTPDQIADYNLPTIPAKPTDKRGNNVKDTCQVEALPPDILAGIVNRAILNKYDKAQFEADKRAEDAEREEVLQRLNVL